MLSLSTRLIQDRLKRLMTWSAYAKFVGIPESTMYAVRAGNPPSELTKAKIEACLKRAE